MQYTPWTDYIKPGRIFGNLYFVGARSASSHLIETTDGLILLDSGYPHNLYLLIHNIYELGFNIKDIKYILHSHGHYDHLGATKALVELTGAKTILGKPDRDMANGKLPLTWAKELGTVYCECFEPDILLHDGDVITLGNTSIRCVSTPGHTPGTFSFFFDVTDGETTLRAGMHGGVGLNSLKKDFLEEYGLSFDCRDDFIKGLQKVRNEKVDIFLGNHVGNNDTEGKLAALERGEENPFIDSTAFGVFIDSVKERFHRTMEQEI